MMLLSYEKIQYFDNSLGIFTHKIVSYLYHFSKKKETKNKSNNNEEKYT